MAVKKPDYSKHLENPMGLLKCEFRKYFEKTPCPLPNSYTFLS
jgi:hypothetical protein